MHDAVEDAAVLHVGGEEAEGDGGEVGPGDGGAGAEGAVAHGDEAVALDVEGDGLDAADGFGAEVGDAGVGFQVFEVAEDLGGGAGGDGELEGGVPLEDGGGEGGDGGEGGGDDGDAEVSGEAGFEALELLAHGAGVAD